MDLHQDSYYKNWKLLNLFFILRSNLEIVLSSNVLYLPACYSPTKTELQERLFFFLFRAGQRLIEFCQENALVITNTLFQQHERRLYTWTSPDGQYWNQIDYILYSQNGEVLYSQQKQDQELTVAQIMNSLLPNSDLNCRK